jgi:uncharacterized RDD family membrane protein YckC
LFIVFQFVDFYGLFDSEENSGRTTLLFVILLPIILYYPLLENFFGGKTIGKGLLKIRVTNMEGKPASLSEIVLRWLLRTIDIKIGFIVFIISAFFESLSMSTDLLYTLGVFMSLPLPIVGIIMILVTENSQRLGDFAAGTIVVHDKKRVSLNETLLKSKIEDYEPVFKQVLKLRDKDIYIIKNIVEQAEKGNHTQVVPLANKAKKILGVESDLLPLVFLKTLLNDYNHLAQEKDLG